MSLDEKHKQVRQLIAECEEKAKETKRIANRLAELESTCADLKAGKDEAEKKLVSRKRPEFTPT